MPVETTQDKVKSLNDIQTQFGGANPIAMTEYYSGGPYMPAGQYTYANYGTGLSGSSSGAPSSGTISMTDISLIPALVWAKGAGPLNTGYGSSVAAGWKSLAECGVDAGALTTGRQIYINISMNASWLRYPTMTDVITVGTSKTFRTPVNYDKTFNMQCQYNGGTDIYLYGWYSGPSTGSPNGQVFLTGIGVV